LRPFPLPLVEAVLVARRRRFLADVLFRDGRREVVHCPNPGAMTTCSEPGSRVLLSDRGLAGRRLRYTLEMVRVGRGWAGVNTMVANRVVGHWLRSGLLIRDRGPVRPEATWGDSRFDFQIGPSCLLEVKTVTLVRDGVAAFPDAVTARGRRHVERLARLRRRGVRCVLLYFVSRPDAWAVRPADEIDPQYGRAVRRAAAGGVEIVAVRARFTRRGVSMGPRLEVLL
jgi:sugar fermentation stimulation protein A